ncbi:MAG: phenylalanine--tRNA ligase subunit alpha [Hyphomicrobiales bacterium]|nr:phenylalanine--tRNA ligase subunit alpha [Hyphomicrobiales bacterium]
MSSEMKSLESVLLADIASAADLAAIEQVRVAALGKKGRISELMGQLGKLPADERKAFGAAVNALKGVVSDAIDARKRALESAALSARLANERADVTLPVRPGPLLEGRIHPVSQVFDEIAEIFADMGFSIAEGPDIESDDLNFTKLNMPPEHPARQMHDTFYLRSPERVAKGEAPLVLRTHTSPVQIRTMMKQKPPIRIIAPGRVYRMDSDATHTPMFHQIEGLVIDESTHFGHMKWCLEEFCKAFFEVDQVKMRFRASHFPFTEPSAEVDVGAEAIGKPGQWLEILGCGMVHPKVIANCGLDPEKYQGWAFGMGLDRITMLKYGIPDLRDMFNADLRWLKHYGFVPLDVPTLAGGMSG